MLGNSKWGWQIVNKVPRPQARQSPCDTSNSGRRLLLSTATERDSMADTSSAFTATSAFSIAGVFCALAFAYFGLVKLLPKTASRTDKFTFVWLVSDLESLRAITEGGAIYEVFS